MSHIRNHAAYHAAIKRNATSFVKSAPVQRYIARRKTAALGYINRAAKSGAITRQMGRYGTSYGGLAVGQGAQAIGRAITGHGAYHVNSLVHKGGAKRHTGFKMHHGEKGEMIIEHSEYVNDLVSASSASTTSSTSGASYFTSQSYGINAANSALFEWLAPIAAQFEMFTFEKLVFEYRPLISESTSTSAATLTSMGTVMAAVEYDSSRGLFPNKAQLLNAHGSVDAKPSDKFMAGVECKHKYNPLGVYYTNASPNYINTGATNSAPTVVTATNYDIRMQNMGIIQFSSVNVPVIAGNSLSLGEIFCHYKVRLMKPLVGNFTSLLSAHYESPGTTNSNIGTTDPFGVLTGYPTTYPVQNPGSLLALTFSDNGTITFPQSVTQGNFLLMYYVSGTPANTNTAPGNTGFVAGAGANCSVIALFGNDAVGTCFAPSTLGGTVPTTDTWICGAVITINAPGATQATVRLTTATIPTAGEFDLLVTPFNSKIVT